MTLILTGLFPLNIFGFSSSVQQSLQSGLVSQPDSNPLFSAPVSETLFALPFPMVPLNQVDESPVLFSFVSVDFQAIPTNFVGLTRQNHLIPTNFVGSIRFRSIPPSFADWL